MFVGGRRLVPTVVGFVLAIGLSGCSGSSGSPTVVPPLSTTPAATSSTPPQDPKAAAVAVVREYFRAKNELATDVTASHLAAVTTADCACRELVRSARRLAKQGRHYFGHATIKQLVTSSSGATTVQLLVRYDSTAGGIKDARGSVISRDEAHHGVRQLFVVRLSDGRWRVSQIVLVQGGN